MSKHSLRVGRHFFLVYLRMCKTSRGTTYEIYGAKNEWSRSQTNARRQPPQSGQDVKVELGTEPSHGRDMEVTVR